MGQIREALEAELLAEQEFVAAAHVAETAPKRWPAALLMFHVSMWRERLRDRLTDLRDGRDYPPPPEDPDTFNDAELANGIGTPLADAAARSERLLREILALHEALGERPFKWYRCETTTEAVLRASYLHPRIHMYEYALENGEPERGIELFERAAADMRQVKAPKLILGAAIYNLAAARVAQDRKDDALTLLEEALGMRPDLKETAAEDPDLAPLREESGFQKLVS